MQQPVSKRIGMLTPSSNTVLEPLTAAMLSDAHDVTAHFGRFSVVKISLDNDALEQFSNEPMLQASQLLAEACVDVICWNGTSSGWLGFDSDQRLCEQIEEHTDIPACTSVLALNEILALQNATRIAFVTPYLDEIQAAIVKTYQSAGFEVVAEQHLGDAGNYSFAKYTKKHIIELCRKVAEYKPQAICTFCTNFRGAEVASFIEHETGIPVFDTVSTALWKSLRSCDVDTTVIKGWGSIFDVG
jgi:maleate isomerase